MVINRDDLLLVSRELTDCPFQSNEYRILLTLEPHRGRAELHGLHGVLNLVEAALGAPYCHVTIVLVAELLNKKWLETL